MVEELRCELARVKANLENVLSEQRLAAARAALEKKEKAAAAKKEMKDAAAAAAAAANKKKKGAFKGEFVPEPSSDEDDAAPIEAGDGKDVDKWFVQRKTQWSAADQGAGGGGGDDSGGR